jgi:hypothetical protein
MLRRKIMPLNDAESAKKLEYYKDLINKAFTRIRVSEISKMEENKKPENAMNMKDAVKFSYMLGERLRKLNKL